MTKTASRVRSRRKKRKITGQSKSPDSLDRVFKALANADRRRILDILCDGRRTTGDICLQFPELDRCTVMLHLKALEQADLVIAARAGKTRWNYLNHLPIQAVYRRWIKTFAEPAVHLLECIRQQAEME